MPLGHNYTPIVRVTPPAGPAYTVTLSGLTRMTVCQPTYEPLHVVKEMLTRAIRKAKYGWRVHVRTEFIFVTPSADETTLAQQVTTPASHPTVDYGFELSLDGGTTYRAVDVVDFTREPLEGKNTGLQVGISWTCQQPIEELPAVGSGSW